MVGIAELITMSVWVAAEVCFIVIKGKGTVCTLYGKCTLANFELRQLHPINTIIGQCRYIGWFKYGSITSLRD